MYKWVRKADVTGATLKTTRPGQAPIALTEQAFIVKQAAGSSLGYTITPYDPATATTDETPSLVAFPVAVQKSGTLIRFALENGGRAVSGSERQVRVVKPLPGFAWFAFFALAPLLAMTLVLALRARRMSRARAPSNSRQ
jgi:hypothetical protein